MSETLISIIGCGRVGSTLALALLGAGYRLAAVVDNNMDLAVEVKERTGARLASTTLGDEIKSSSIVIVSVSDAKIVTVAQEMVDSNSLFPGQVVCHTSGFHPSAILSSVRRCGARIASLHPLASIAHRFSVLPRKTYFGLEGDEIAVSQLRGLAATCGWATVDVGPEQKALYHAACVLATGMNAALLGVSQNLFRDSGLGDESLAVVRSLAESVAANIRSSEIAEAITGPLVRGQIDVVAEHLRVLEAAAPKVAVAYRMLGLATMEIMGEALDEEVRGKMERMLRTN